VRLNSSKKSLILGHRLFSVTKEPLESLGDSITTALLVSWAKEVGDPIREDDVVAVVETDKVTMDIRAKKSGVMTAQLVELDTEIDVGADLYEIDTSVDAMPVSSESTKPAEESAPAPAAVVPSAGGEPVVVDVPIMGESITQGMLASWSVQPGDFVNADDVVALIETDKVNVEVRTPSAGKIVEIFASEDDEVEVGKPLFTLDPSAEGVAVSSSASAAEPAAEAAAPAPAAAAPAPAAPTPSAAKPAKAAAPAEPTAPAPASARSEERVKMSRMRQRIAVRLKEAQNTAAMLTTFQECDMGYLMEMRNKHKEEFEKKHGVKLGFMSAFVAASTAALQEIPAVNAVIDDETNEVVYRNYVDISVAVASPSGLVVPVLRDCQNMDFADVEKTIGAYGAKAKAGTMALEDMAGGTFTISNGGVFGSLMGTPIINPPQSAILGMHATKMRAVVKDGQVVARPMMYLALTYDHRLVDGREAVTFLKSIANKIEDPHRLLLDI
jgi:2-oxoglutarate dehydrogenase E2 component (dihydrolipoamide succinyltransferase)